MLTCNLCISGRRLLFVNNISEDRNAGATLITPYYFYLLTNFGLRRVLRMPSRKPEEHHSRVRLPGNSSKPINVMLPVQSFPKK
jgi:hypothetical protein